MPRHVLRARDLAAITAICAVCGPVALVWRREAGGRYVCPTAQVERDAKWRQQVQPHGLTAAEAAAFTAGKTCEVCGTTDDLCLDHDHRTGRRRGVLCRTHNAAAGALGDDPATVRALLAYLERAET